MRNFLSSTSLSIQSLPCKSVDSPPDPRISFHENTTPLKTVDLCANASSSALASASRSSDSELRVKTNVAIRSRTSADGATRPSITSPLSLPPQRMVTIVQCPVSLNDNDFFLWNSIGSKIHFVKNTRKLKLAWSEKLFVENIFVVKFFFNFSG